MMIALYWGDHPEFKIFLARRVLLCCDFNTIHTITVLINKYFLSGIHILFRRMAVAETTDRMFMVMD